jgi:hypothetical protein
VLRASGEDAAKVQALFDEAAALAQAQGAVAWTQRINKQR